MCLALARIFRSASRLPACRCRARHDPGLRCHGHDARWRSAGGRCISRAGRMRPPRRCIVRMRHACWRRKPPSYMRRASTQSHGREVRGRARRRRPPHVCRPTHPASCALQGVTAVPAVQHAHAQKLLGSPTSPLAGAHGTAAQVVHFPRPPIARNPLAAARRVTWGRASAGIRGCGR